jgi:hypothetical protein
MTVHALPGSKFQQMGLICAILVTSHARPPLCERIRVWWLIKEGGPRRCRSIILTDAALPAQKYSVNLYVFKTKPSSIKWISPHPVAEERQLDADRFVRIDAVAKEGGVAQTSLWCGVRQQL